MNIHFKDEKLFENLKKATLAKVRVGSFLYGTQTASSDEDWFYIYATSRHELNSFVQTNHQLQYKEEGADHNFVSLHTFIRNIVNGDSSINFEVVHSDELIGTVLEFLHDSRDMFNTYTVIRNYNGLCKRDVKHWHRAKNDREKFKRFGHILRGYTYAEFLLDGKFDFDVVNAHYRTCLDSYRNCDMDALMTRIGGYNKMLDDQRRLLNAGLENKTLGLPKVMDVGNGRKLDAWMQELTGGYREHQKHLDDFNMDIFINAVENWVSYE